MHQLCKIFCFCIERFVLVDVKLNVQKSVSFQDGIALGGLLFGLVNLFDGHDITSSIKK